MERGCIASLSEVAAFDGGAVSPDAGAVLLGKIDAAFGLIDQLAGCLIEERAPGLIEHLVRTLAGQRVRGIGRQDKRALARSHAARKPRSSRTMTTTSHYSFCDVSCIRYLSNMAWAAATSRMYSW